MSRIQSDPTFDSNSPKNENEIDDIEAAINDPAATEVSEEFVGRWQTLVSTTNWEKGKIIFDWRKALVDTGSPSRCYSDEVWARRVGGVTAQHVGRLRRVFERFGETFNTYPKIYWSHFLAVLDWDDAEMWLEGAVQSHWSVSEMRNARWQALGADPSNPPQVEEIVGTVVDEDYSPLSEVDDDVVGAEGSARPEVDPEQEDRIGTDGPYNEGPDFGDQESSSKESSDDSEDDEAFEAEAPQPVAANPFINLPELPSDVADCLEQFKLSIVRHRVSEWSEISQDDMLRVIDALRHFVVNRAE